MTNYSENTGSVRVDYFKPSGKWYMTEAVDMSDVYSVPFIFDAIRKAMDMHWVTHHHGRATAWQQFTIVITEPYHESAYPIMILATPHEPDTA